MGNSYANSNVTYINFPTVNNVKIISFITLHDDDLSCTMLHLEHCIKNITRKLMGIPIRNASEGLRQGMSNYKSPNSHEVGHIWICEGHTHFSHN